VMSIMLPAHLRVTRPADGFGTGARQQVGDPMPSPRRAFRLQKQILWPVTFSLASDPHFGETKRLYWLSNKMRPLPCCYRNPSTVGEAS
jgi:hypothetical protein